MGKIRVGIIGAGSWTVASHLPSLVRHDDVELVAVARKGPEMLARIQQDWDIPIASEDYHDVLDAGLDVCIVGSPSGLHFEHTVAALDAGAHVMCEKPFTIDPAQAWRIDDVRREKGLEVVVAFGWNYRPMVQQAKRMMDEYGIGSLEQMSITMSSVTRELLSNTGAYPDAAPETVPEQGTWTDRRLSGGGYGQAQLSHALGLALWLTGARAESAFALMSAPLDAPVELHDAITYRFDNGAIGVMSGSSAHMNAWGNRHSLEVRGVGSDGQFLIDVEREAFWLFSNGEDRKLDIPEGDGMYDCVGPIDAVLAAARGEAYLNQSPAELGART
ncbi:MAG: Gfo/Idh/MocA family protein, partial [Candidatus Nanopelagicales bacterium]